MKVLLYTTHYPATDAPLRGLYNQQAFVALGRRLEVRVVGAAPWWTKLRRPRDLLAPQRENSFGLDAAFPVMWSVPGLHALHASAATLSVKGFVSHLRREFPFDVIIASWAYPDCVSAAYLAQAFGVPLISLVLGSDINDLGARMLIRPQIQWGLQRADRVVAVSGALAAGVSKLGVPSSRIRVQHNAVDGQRFRIRSAAESSDRLGLPHSKSRIGFVGRLSEEKGVKVLLESVALLRDQFRRPDVELCIVGGGPLDQSLRSKARDLGIVSNVRFAGPRPHEEIPLWVSACDALCLPSFREGCPNVVLEALASGRPVVATSVGGVPELVFPSNGMLTPPGDAAQLASALNVSLSRQWDPPALRASAEFLSWDAVAQFYVELIEEVMEDRMDRRREVLPAS